MHCKYINILKNDLLRGNDKKKSLNFFRYTSTSVLIWFTILEYSFHNKELNLENLVNEIRAFNKASKPTILKILDNGVSKNLIFKTKSERDKRLTLYSPTDLTIREFKEWSENLFNLKII